MNVQNHSSNVVGSGRSSLLLEMVMVGLGATLLHASTNPLSTTQLWFDKPASSFHQSFPLGNGRIGAMIFGGVNEERIVLNESSLWSGSPQDADRPEAHEVLP